MYVCPRCNNDAQLIGLAPYCVRLLCEACCTIWTELAVDDVPEELSESDPMIVVFS